MDQKTWYGHLSALTMLQHILSNCWEIYEINLKENLVKMMGPYDHEEPLAQLIEQLEKGRFFAQSGGQTISDANMVSKRITLLVQTWFFNDDIR